MADISKVKNPDGNTYNVKDSTARDHIANKNNPHSVTKAQIGLGNVDNTSDLNKPVSNAVRTALDAKANNSVATESINGLMSAADKKAVDREFFRMLPKGGTYIPANADLNSIEYIKVGTYYNPLVADAVTMTNIPASSAFQMYVLSPLSEAYDNEKTSTWVYRLRIFVGFDGRNIYTQMVWSRTTVGAFSYDPWVKLTDSDDLSKISNIINSHIANENNPHKVTAAQVGALPLSGGTLTGNLTAPSFNGKVNGYTINANVPAGAKFTDTTYSNATTSAPGLMSSADKAKLDGIAAGAEKNAITGVKGSSESSYRTGNVNITKANIGLSNVDNTADANKSVKSATSATKDSAGQQINTTYIKELSALGRTITATKGNGSKSIFNIAGDDLYLFYRGVAVGDLNEITTTGIYYVMSGGLANTGPSNIDITYCYLIVIGFAALKQQIILKPDTGIVLMRSYLGQHTDISEDDTLLDENSEAILDEKGDALIGTFKTPPTIAKNSSSVWSRWYKINGIGV